MDRTGSDGSAALEFTSEKRSPGKESVLVVVRDLIEDLRHGGEARKGQSALQVYRGVIAKAAPRVNRSVKLLTADLLHWMNRGGP